MKIANGLSAFLLISLYASASFASGDCQFFAGKYAVNSQGCYESHDGRTYPDYTYTGMIISADATTDNLSMFYREGDQGYTVNYIADGQEHNGDYNNSGKTYTASCQQNKILSVRNGMFTAPLIMTFAKNQDGTYTLTETITSNNPFTRSCSLTRMP
jgi:hypothetical protein